MIRFIAIAATGVLCLVSGAQAQSAHCYTKTDLGIAKPIQRAFEIIDADKRGCVVQAQIDRYLAADKADRATRRDRIRAAMAAK